MSLWAEMRRGVPGAIRLIKGDPGGFGGLVVSREGFWRSFFAAVVLLPLVAAYHEYAHRLDIAGAEPDAAALAAVDPAKRWTLEAIGYVLSWTLWPLAAFYLARAFGAAPRFLGYAVAYNWAQIVTVSLSVLPYLAVAPLAGPDAGALASLIGFILAIGLEMRLAVNALGIRPVQAALVQLVAILLSFLNGAVTRALMLTGAA
jgi:hypothetical protein